MLSPTSSPRICKAAWAAPALVARASKSVGSATRNLLRMRDIRPLRAAVSRADVSRPRRPRPSRSRRSSPFRQLPSSRRSRKATHGRRQSGPVHGARRGAGPLAPRFAALSSHECGLIARVSARFRPFVTRGSGPRPPRGGGGISSTAMMQRHLLQTAAALAADYLDGLATRAVAPTQAALEGLRALERPLPDGPTDPTTALAELHAVAPPPTLASAGGRFFGFVVGGSLPVALAASARHRLGSGCGARGAGARGGGAPGGRAPLVTRGAPTAGGIGRRGRHRGPDRPTHRTRRRAPPPPPAPPL